MSVTQQIYVQNLNALYGSTVHMTVWEIVAFCVIFGWYFVHVLFVFLHVQISPPCRISVLILQDNNIPHIIFPHICEVNFLLCIGNYSLETLLSLICLNTLLHFL